MLHPSIIRALFYSLAIVGAGAMAIIYLATQQSMISQ
jgi:hypothetical protein